MQTASPERPAMVATVELNGFGDWVAEHGFSAGDAMIERVAERVQQPPPGTGCGPGLGPHRLGRHRRELRVRS